MPAESLLVLRRHKCLLLFSFFVPSHLIIYIICLKLFHPFYMTTKMMQVRQVNTKMYPILLPTHTQAHSHHVWDFIFSTHKTASSYFTLHRGKYLKSQVFPSFTSGLYVFKCCYNHERKNWVWENHKTAVQYKIAHILRLLGIQSGRWSRLRIGRTDKKSSVA